MCWCRFLMFCCVSYRLSYLFFHVQTAPLLFIVLIPHKGKSHIKGNPL